ncbi:hypothetical protein [Rhizobium leguminosarum]|uniref:hypothetical protein n=1 Tax=Rhizobium leguminosarum TaxID=384 RepID=UPI0012BC0495|nr:hypothetical protein [Rhizobium leguminosarum]
MTGEVLKCRLVLPSGTSLVSASIWVEPFLCAKCIPLARLRSERLVSLGGGIWLFRFPSYASSVEMARLDLGSDELDMAVVEHAPELFVRSSRHESFALLESPKTFCVMPAALLASLGSAH